MIKWIPRTARQHCATLLTKLILSVVNKPKDVGEWEKLLAFGRSILHRPPKGNSRRNLTNIIAHRCSEFSTNPYGAELPASHRARAGMTRKVKTDSKKGEDEGGLAGLARAVTVRLEEGNYKGAVRLLVSNDTLAFSTPEILQALREKHSPTPSNRRPALPPDPKQTSIAFAEAQVRKALVSFPPGSSGGCDGLTPQHNKDMVKLKGKQVRYL